MTISQRAEVEGVPCDVLCMGRFYDFLEKRDPQGAPSRTGQWGLVLRQPTYEKDRMDPHVPGSVPVSYYEQLDLSRYPTPVRFHCYRNERSSGHAPKNMIIKGSAEEKAARLPAIMTVPMIVFILPTLFIVLIGPAVLNVYDSLIKH